MVAETDLVPPAPRPLHRGKTQHPHAPLLLRQIILRHQPRRARRAAHLRHRHPLRRRRHRRTPLRRRVLRTRRVRRRVGDHPLVEVAALPAGRAGGAAEVADEGVRLQEVQAGAPAGGEQAGAGGAVEEEDVVGLVDALVQVLRRRLLAASRVRVIPQPLAQRADVQHRPLGARVTPAPGGVRVAALLLAARARGALQADLGRRESEPGSGVAGEEPAGLRLDAAIGPSVNPSIQPVTIRDAHEPRPAGEPEALRGIRQAAGQRALVPHAEGGLVEGLPLRARGAPPLGHELLAGLDLQGIVAGARVVELDVAIEDRVLYHVRAPAPVSAVGVQEAPGEVLVHVESDAEWGRAA
mmetsp:Transcript_58564/g.156548  ORF Transcript_58564/g.156548 Transcript_58564/m.156548 type:complete len:354 (-) Transcript_58564:1761-2822(-)